jgi:hypothetical protein
VEIYNRRALQQDVRDQPWAPARSEEVFEKGPPSQLTKLLGEPRAGAKGIGYLQGILLPVYPIVTFASFRGICY